MNLELTFDEILYWIPASGETKDICYVVNRNSSVSDTPPDDDKGTPGQKVFINYIGGSGAAKLTPVVRTTPSSTFTFKYTNVKVGDRITFFTNGYISDANGNSTRDAITLEYQIIKTGLNNATTGGWVIISQ